MSRSAARGTGLQWVCSLAICVIPALVLVLASRRSDATVGVVDRLLEATIPLLLVAAILTVVCSWLVSDAWREGAARLSEAWWASPTWISVACCLCIAPALVSWRRADWAYQKVAGVLPWSDSNGYHQGGVRFLHTGELTVSTCGGRSTPASTPFGWRSLARTSGPQTPASGHRCRGGRLHICESCRRSTWCAGWSHDRRDSFPPSPDHSSITR